MSEIPYTPLAGKMEEYFTKFQEAGVPDKVNTAWLNTLGFKGGNDAYILRVLRYINFIDSSGVPTEFWKQYKDPTKSKVVLAQAIRQGYKKSCLQPIQMHIEKTVKLYMPSLVLRVARQRQLSI